MNISEKVAHEIRLACERSAFQLVDWHPLAKSVVSIINRQDPVPCKQLFRISTRSQNLQEDIPHGAVYAIEMYWCKKFKTPETEACSI